ncbi:MAG: glutamine--fructose-6-phosphate transaminase (isomerizing) [Candidatus Bathyarchaeota archaeon]|nr:glutamine--fructose-6-phosphate transaminase (isomerizing) [Candidatus Bathyarchaeota archaeon]
MCGIFGCVLRNEMAGPIIRSALERLEYRGYDSIGQATLSSGKIFVKKDKGKISEVQKTLNFDEMLGKLGLGHTRWATHGMPSKENAHPHLDCDGNIAVVHNGIIENFMELRKNLEPKHKFRSRTDSEVISHLIEDYMEEGENLEEATRLTAKRIKGSFAVAAISNQEHDKLVCIKKESPLIVGVGEEGVYCSSDMSALLPLTKNALIMEDGELGVLKIDEIKFIKIKNGESVKKEITKIEWTLSDAMKGGYPHFTIKEINEQPTSIRNTLRISPIYHELIASKLCDSERIFLIACGTSYHACIAGSYLFSKISKIDSRPVIASEFKDQYSEILNSKTAIIALSQSGETADTIEALKTVREKKASILSITNVMGSSITRFSDIYIGQNSGPEIGVAATKSFTSQLAILTKLALTMATKRNSMDEENRREIDRGLKTLPSYIEKVIERVDDKVKSIAKKYVDSESFSFLGRGINSATALEGRLKLLELTYTPSLAYPAGEVKHGFIATVESNRPAIFIAPRDDNHNKIINNIMELKSRGAKIISLIEKDDKKIIEMSDDYIEMPQMHALLTPLTYIVPLQLFAYYMAVEKDLDPDKPRHLAKSVTVE